MPSSLRDKDVTRLLRQQAALASFGSFAFREPELLNVLNEAARVCAEGLGVPFCKICRYRMLQNDLRVEAGYGWSAGVVGIAVSQADETSPQGRAYITGEPVIMENLPEANDVILPAFYREHGIISTVDVIIKGMDGDPYGVLEIDSPVQHTYDEHDVIFLTGFANVLAEAVATANRKRALQQSVERLAALVAEKDQLIGEHAVFAAELKHRVCNDLHLIHGMLVLHEKNLSAADSKVSVGNIIRRVMTLGEVYEQLLGTGLSHSADFGEYLKVLCSSLPELQTNPHSKITLVCEAEALPVDLDTMTALGMAVAELVSNSYEHAGATTVAVTLEPPGADGAATLTVSDDSTGFVEQPSSKRHGVGLARGLVQQVRGTIERNSNGGTSWTIRFPVAAEANRAASVVSTAMFDQLGNAAAKPPTGPTMVDRR